MNVKSLLLPLFAVATLFPRLLALHGLPAQVQLTELLFLPLLWAYRRDVMAIIRERPFFSAGAGLYLVANAAAALWAGTPAALFEAGARAYLAGMAILTVAHLQRYGATGLARWWKWGTVGAAVISLAGYAWAAAGGPDTLHFVARIPEYPYLGPVLRLRGTANVYGMLYMLLLPGLLLAYTEARTDRGRWWPVAVILLACLATLGKENLLFPIGAALYEARRHPRFRWPLRLLAAGLVGVLMVGTHYIVLGPGEQLSEPGYTSGRTALTVAGFDFEETNYTANKRAAWLIGLQHPLVGVGAGQFSRHTLALVPTGGYPAHFNRFDPHSTWTGTFAENGLLGLLGLIILVVALWRFAPAAAPVVGTLLLLFLVASVFKDLGNYRALWVLVGWGLWGGGVPSSGDSKTFWRVG